MNIDGLRFQLLSHIALAGDFPASLASLIIPSSSYREKVLTTLKSQKLIRTYYKDGMRSYRATAAGRKALQEAMPVRFAGLPDTASHLKSEPARRYRLFQLAQAALTMENAGVRIFKEEKADLFSSAIRPLELPFEVPAYYSSLEVKALGIDAVKIKNGRFCGILLTHEKVWIVYHVGACAMRWSRRSEIKTRAVLTHLLCRVRLPGLYHAEDVQAVLLGKDMETCGRLLAAEQCRDARMFRFDQTYEHFHFIPESSEGDWLLALLMDAGTMKRLKGTLSQNLKSKDENIGIENDGFKQDGTPVLFSFDGDAQRLVNFVRALRIQGCGGVAYCFDFQLSVFKEYAADTVVFQAIRMKKFLQQFY